MMKATEAVVLNKLGGVVGLTYTSAPNGARVRYYTDSTDGTPVNTRRGKISRDKRFLEALQIYEVAIEEKNPRTGEFLYRL